MTMNPRIKGKLKSTGKKQSIHRAGKRTLFEDEEGKLFVRIDHKWWQFPDQVEH